MTSFDDGESAQLDRLQERLTARFSPPLRREQVAQCLRTVIAAFATARVRTYLPVLIERAATERLLLAVDDAGRAIPRCTSPDDEARHPVLHGGG